MNIKFIIIILGEPYSTFSEIVGKYFTDKKNNKKKIVIIGNKSLFEKQLIKLKYKLNIKEIKNLNEAKKNTLNIINVDFKYKKIFGNITSKSRKFIENCFNLSLSLIRNQKSKYILINGPISKKSFLSKRFLGITEYLSSKTKSKNEVMLIYNKDLSVTPLTTHIPIKLVSKNVSKKKIINNIQLICAFYKKYLKKKIKIAVLGLNPHCETVDKVSEEESIIKPAIKNLKYKGIDISGPFSADTFFLKDNIKKYDLVMGMYHDQVLTPIKTLFKFNAINITIGLPFIRISPDHGPNFRMLGMNKSNPSSFYYAMKFIEKL